MPTVTHIESEAKFRRCFGDEVPFRGEGFYDKTTGEKDERPDKPLGCPMIMSDVPAHMHAGKYISGRAAQRELEKTDGLVPYERTGTLMSAPNTVYDENCDKWKSWMSDQMNKVAKKAGLDPASSHFEKSISGELAEVKRETLAGKKRGRR